jgi:CYTH domain-containing protein
MEIERKWLVDKVKVTDLLLKGSYVRRERLEQYYLNTINDEWLIRLRTEGNKYFLTLKSKGLIAREELEYHIDMFDFEKSIKYAKSSLKKYRYVFPINVSMTKYAQIDVYDDYDFIICEVEFESEEEANAFIPPDWCIQDITNDKKYKNVNLAKVIE